MIKTASHPAFASATDPAMADLFEELAGRIATGEPVDPESIALEHPELAEPLRRVLPAIEALIDLGRTAAREVACMVPGGPDPGPAPSVLGDFRIIREIGRGGMGIVYEAQQISLVRRVALKVLPFAAALDPKQLQRFRVEAQAAAQLHHTHIVPVFSVGCERGVHYFAMQFIEGQTLADLIRELRRYGRPDAADPLRMKAEDMPNSRPATSGYEPVADQPGAVDPPGIAGREGPASGMTESFTETVIGSSAKGLAFYRTVADLGLQAAEALEHAHQLGVLHRDIKPANLLVDGRGHLWMTDFGLARLQGDSDLTLTGDLMGSLRYMSPEQATARPVSVDHRTDIYSLGVTLYELLTLKPALCGENRQEVLRQILQEEPCPPRRINRAIPRDLETIVLKAMAKAPADRYASAQELADDLRCYLDHRTIRARRPSLVQRAVNWARRHRSIVWSIVVVLVLAVIGLAVSNVRIRWEKDAKEVALWQKDEALRARGVALARARANEERALVEAAKVTAISDLLQEMLTSANPDRVKGMHYTVRELLDDFSERLDGQLDGQPEVEAAIRKAIGVAYRRLGMPDKAAPHLEAAIDLRRRTFGAAHEQVAESLVDYAWNLAAAGRYGQAEDRVREALVIYRGCDGRTEPPIAALWALVWLQVYQGNHAQAEEAAREALVIARKTAGAESPEIANILHTLADSKNDQGRFDEAEPLAREAVVLHRRLHGDSHPETGWGLNALARAQLGRGLHAEAEVHYREALSIFRRHHGGEHKGITQVLKGLMSALRAQGDQAGVDSLIRQKLADATSRVEREPENPEAWLRRGAIHVELGQLADAETAFREALRLDPDRPVHHDALGDVLLRQGRLSESEAALRNGISLKPDAGKIHTRLGLVLWNQGRTEEALASHRKAVEVEPESCWAWQALGWTMYRAGAWEDSIKALETSCNLQPGGTGDCGQWIVLALAHWRLAGQQDLPEPERAQLRSEARRWYDQAVKQFDGIHRQGEVMPAIREFFEEAAELLDRKGQK